MTDTHLLNMKQLESLARSAEDDCQRAIHNLQKARMDLRCLEESTVDKKAFEQKQAQIAVLETEQFRLREGIRIAAQMIQTDLATEAYHSLNELLKPNGKRQS